MTTTLMNDRRLRAHAERLLDLPPNRQFATIVNWLTGHDQGRLAVATEIVVRTGACVTPGLVSAALAPRKQASDCVRLLEAVEKIGKPLAVGQWLDLCGAMGRCGPEVQHQIGRVLAAHRRADCRALRP